MKLRGILEYRKKGNCFATCIVNGLQLLNDKNLINDNLPEGKVFPPQILYDQDETKENSYALSYLVKNNYQVIIVDPNPTQGNIWGNNLNRVIVEKRNYEKSDVEKYLKEGRIVIFSTHGTNNQNHAILGFRSKLYDPQSHNLWQSPSSLNEYIKRAKTFSQGQYLITFRKKMFFDILNSFLASISNFLQHF